MIREIGVEQLRVGMYVHKTDQRWIDTPFWRPRLRLKNQDELDAIAGGGCRRVWIDTSRGDDVAIDSARPIPESKPAAKLAPVAAPVDTTPSSWEQEVTVAASIKANAGVAVASMYEEARLGHCPRLAQTAPIVNQITHSIQRNRSALLSLVRLKNKDDYTFMHSVAVCTLMVALAIELGLSQDEIQVAGIAGLLHDIGKTQMPHEILNKPGKLSANEFVQVQEHPKAGAALLSAAEGMPAGAIDVCLHHHERMDGKGYPDGLSGEQITRLARMSSVCDVYDAVTSDRPYKSAWTPAVAIQEMAAWRRGAFDEEIFQAFVRCVGVYPIGSLVRLDSGRLAVVLAQHESDLLTPKVKAVYNAQSNQRMMPEIIDLGAPGCNDRISGRERLEDWPKLASLERYWLPTLKSA